MEVEVDCYSNEEDIIIIKFFNENLSLLHNKDRQIVYQILKEKCNFSKTAKSLENRFMNTILPHLYNYSVLSYTEMIVFYDKADLEIPLELQRLITEKLEREREPIIVEDDEVSPDPLTHSSNCIIAENSASNVQTDRQNVDYRHLKFITLDHHICLYLQNEKHIFLDKTASNLWKIKKRLINRWGVLRSNIHLLSRENFNFLTAYKESSTVFCHEIKKIIKPCLEVKETIDLDPVSDKEPQLKIREIPIIICGSGPTNAKPPETITKQTQQPIIIDINPKLNDVDILPIKTPEIIPEEPKITDVSPKINGVNNHPITITPSDAKKAANNPGLKIVTLRKRKNTDTNGNTEEKPKAIILSDILLVPGNSCPDTKENIGNSNKLNDCIRDLVGQINSTDWYIDAKIEKMNRRLEMQKKK